MLTKTSIEVSQDWVQKVEARLGGVESRQVDQEQRLAELEDTTSFLTKDTEYLRRDLESLTRDVRRNWNSLATPMLIAVVISMVIYIIYITSTQLYGSNAEG